jgi:serine/threonine protein kinase
LHSQKPCVVHCDLKPANIIITQHRETGPFAKLLDFGLAAAGTRHATVDGGTAKFLAPEAYSAECRARARPAVDIYAVGRLLCYAATLGSSLEVPEPGSAECSPLLQAWTPLIMACLSRDPSQRPTARDLDAQLQEQIDPDPATWRCLEDRQAVASRLVL